MRKSYRPKAPRVVIDTSFIEGPPRPLDEAEFDEVLLHDDADYADHVELLADTAGGDGGAAPYGRPGSAAFEPWNAHEAEQDGDDTDLLREAVEQLELADRREAEARERELAALEEVTSLRAQVVALKEAAGIEQKSRSELQQELAGLRRVARQGEPTAQADGSNRRGEPELLQTLKGHKEHADRLEARVAQEKAARVASECRADDLRQELARIDAALADEAQARREADAECRRLEKEASRHGRLTLEAEAQSRQLAELERVLEQVRRREADALRRIAEAERRADKLEAAAGEEKAGRRDAVARLERAELAAADAARELDDLRAALEASARSAEEDREAALADVAHRLAAAEAEVTDVRRREAAALQDKSGAQRRADKLDADLEKEKATGRDLASRLQRAEAAAANSAREVGELRAAADELRAGVEARDRAAAIGGEAETAAAEMSRRIALAESELAESRRREGDALRELSTLRVRTEQFEAAVGAEQDARRDAQERCERAEQAAVRAVEQVLALKAEAERREAELLAQLGEGGQAPAVPVAAAAAAPQASPDVFEPPSKVPSVMRGARGIGTGSGAAAPASVAAVQALEAPEAAATGKRNRRDQRVASRMPVSIWRQGMSQAVGCTLVDKSASGAKVELPPVKFGETNSAVGVGVGDKLTLTFTTAQERTTVSCQVMWFDGRSCGLKYCGPFHTEQIKARRPAPRGKSSLVR